MEISTLKQSKEEAVVAVPQHIAIFLDGNRRWAMERRLDTVEGHRAAYKNALQLIDWSQNRGVKALTVYGFSTENWSREPREVFYLLDLLEQGLLEQYQKYMEDQKEREKGIRVRIIGQRERLPQSLKEAIQKIEDVTKENTKFFLNLAISYGGRWDIIQAFQKIFTQGILGEHITEEIVSQHLSTKGLPELDLIIRPGGAQRLSNFLLWQSAYAELYFSDKYWPDFSEQDFEKALAEYARRQRRFGH